MRSGLLYGRETDTSELKSVRIVATVQGMFS